MSTFWNYHVRLRFARWLMVFALWLWPDGPARNELLEILGTWNMSIQVRNAAYQAAQVQTRKMQDPETTSTFVPMENDNDDLSSVH